LSNAFGERVLLHLAVDPSDRTRLYAATQQSELLASSDGGRTWRALSGIDVSKSGQAPSQ